MSKLPEPTQSVASVVIKREGKYLLVQENQVKAYKKWNLPGGHVDEGETLEAAAVREASEETGYEVGVINQLAVVDRPKDGVKLHAYSAKILGGELQYPADEILDARWFSYAEILEMKPDLRDAEYVVAAIKIAEEAL